MKKAPQNAHLVSQVWLVLDTLLAWEQALQRESYTPKDEYLNRIRSAASQVSLAHSHQAKLLGCPCHTAAALAWKRVMKATSLSAVAKPLPEAVNQSGAIYPRVKHYRDVPSR
jgi:hypothetical protein